ncbi:MAG: class I SAM-dependent methyltransferase [Cellvibrionaceae bacterium]
MFDRQDCVRGEARERQLSRDAYFDDHYFSLPHLVSVSQQLHEIHALKPESILEIGLGNGLVSEFLRRAGYKVKTVDINSELDPDICAPLHELVERLNGETFDLVVCCEVLEHLPLEDFAKNIKILRQAGSRLFMTLPSYYRSFGFGGLLRLPRRTARPFSFHVNVRKEKDLSATQHFWEVYSEAATKPKAICKELRNHYRDVRSWKFQLNPYHICFYAE